MKNLLWMFLILVLFSCGNNNKQQSEKDQNKENDNVIVDLKNKSFDELFKEVAPENFNENVFNLFKEASVLTSGTTDNYNSMAIGYGGWGQYFDGPSTWCFLRANRYTLEYIRNFKTYTMSFFDDQYKDQIIHFGSTSGRDTDKMGTHSLNSVFTPLNNVSYKEAKIIVECELMEISTVNPDDFYFEAGRKFVEEGFEEANDYHKIVFGKIKKIWVRNN